MTYVDYSREFAARVRLKNAGARVDCVVYGPQRIPVHWRRRVPYWQRAKRVSCSEIGNVNEIAFDVGRCSYLEELRLVNCQMSDQHMQPIGGLHALRRLMLDRTLVGDRGIVDLRELRVLFELSLADTNINGETLDSLQDCQHLWSLNVSGCPISSTGMKRLSALGSVEALMIARCDVNDDDMVLCASMKRLWLLDAAGTGISNIGVKYLSRVSGMKKLFGDN